MIVKIEKSFLKSLDKLNSIEINLKIKALIDNLEKAENLSQIKQIKKMIGFKTYYRIKISDYRLGIELIDNQTIVLILISHRKDIYKRFP